MPHDQLPSVGGVYAKRRGNHPAGWAFTSDGGVNCARIHSVLPLLEDALGAYLRDRTSDGQPRPSRRYSPYDHCPWPTLDSLPLK